MFKPPFADQKKQKILNYEIKLIEECSDSLFNSTHCSHQRYLPWNLYRSLCQITQGRDYQIRWMGNEQHSYICAYFYIVITASSHHPSSMLELKSVLYGLAQKYLSQYEQKLLIQFLCLIEYSQEKYLFFRKYARIEAILVKLFKQIEHRNEEPICHFLKNSLEDKTLSKLTTNFTSPCKSIQREGEEGILKEAKGDDRMEPEEQASRMRFVGMFETYGKYFHFVKIEYLHENLMRFSLSFERISAVDSFYVCVEKECFFVAEVGDEKEGSSNLSRNSCSIIAEEKQYLKRLLQNQSKLSNPRQVWIEQQVNENEFTPKFISNKKKHQTLGRGFYDEHSTHKNISVQVLNVKEFTQKESVLHPNGPALPPKKKLLNFQSIQSNTSIHFDRQNEINSRYNFGNNKKKIKTELNVSSRPPYNVTNPHHFPKHYPQMPVKKHPSFNYPTKKFTPYNIQPIKTHNATHRVNPEQLNNPSFQRETILSANNYLPRSTGQIEPFRKFQSLSPRSKLIDLNPSLFISHPVSPLASPLKPRFPLKANEQQFKHI